MVRFKGRWSRTIDYGASLPLMVPGVVMATSLLYTYITFTLPGGFSIYGTLWIMAMAYVVYFLPGGGAPDDRPGGAVVRRPRARQPHLGRGQPGHHGPDRAAHPSARTAGGA